MANETRSKDSKPSPDAKLSPDVKTPPDIKTPPDAKRATGGKPFPSAQSVFAESTIRHVETLIRLDQLNEAVNELEEARRLAPGMVDHIYARTLILRAARKEREGNLEGALADYWAARAIITVSDMAEKLDAIISEVRHNVEVKRRTESPMQHCQNCGRDVEPGWTHCPYCTVLLPNLGPVTAARQPQSSPLPPGTSEKTEPLRKARHVTDILKRLAGKTGKLGPKD